ncbi:HypC/HybG/HupF family hydrogenase formation chaperone [Anaeromicropila herbilytica]|uniref:Hydrogenase assembly protein HypC n=1 Tax=Anaeromicropila herbilytica TaxID=2785025 RepID=A0A7R7EM25_9FIRM|nr:HypC/HybG/HupF family hydrogenase formation chaperone [Anaeromicropila herbilytica]BCN31244.1 hydrogenase assembly protein HypC [Anaeromicropila herbilytica]
MCIALPGRIQEIKEDYAIVSLMETESEVNIGLIEDPKVGDYILVHAGCGIQKIEEHYYHEVQELMSEWVSTFE